MKKADKGKAPKATELDDKTLDEVSGGVELENVRITSYQLGTLDNDAGDGTPDVITAAGPGGGPHVKVFDGAKSR